MEMHTVRFEKVVGGGNALGYVDGKPCFAAGPLPGEIADVRIVKNKANFIEAALIEVTSAHKARSAALENHYLACSPWQSVQYDYQLELKQTMLNDAYARQPLELGELTVMPAVEHLGYRNKVEFSLEKGADGHYGLAFHERGSYEGRLAAPLGCVLASTAMNEAAITVARELDILGVADQVETVMVRESLSADHVLVFVGTKEKVKFDWSHMTVGAKQIVAVGHLTGRNQHKIDWASHKPQLVQSVGGLDLTFRYSSFFQTNIAVFELLLNEILAHVPSGGQALDLYGGVGTIGLAMAQRGDHVLGVEVDQQSSDIAQANATTNGVATYEAYAAGAEHLDGSVFEGRDTIVVDPPRAGLDRRVVAAILDTKPERIVYVSCNPVTQARDFGLLAEAYSPIFMSGYDMYPGTLHLESLLILERRSA